MLDDQTYDIYRNKLTCTINQADSDNATGHVGIYCPHSVSEMSAFVAIIRPGCASFLNDFIHRRPYSTNIPELDALLEDGNHRMIYQELIMKYLIWLGIPEPGSYDIIKKIAKKKFKEEELSELKGRLLKGWVERVGTEQGFIETWTVVEQAASYSFNASHSLSYAYDSLYGAYLKAHYPLDYYTVTLNTYFGDAPRTAKLVAELPYFHIELKPIKFRYSRSQYSFVREKNLIYKGITSIKEMNSEVAEQLYDLRDHQYANFVDCLYDITQNTAIKKNQLALLIRLDFFEEFGDPKQLLQMYKWFLRLKDRKELRQADFDKLPWNMDDLRPYAGTQTAKTLKKIDFHRFMSDYLPRLPWTPATSLERGEAQARYLGYVDVVDASQNDIAIVLDVDTKYSPRLKLYSLRRGIINDCKMNKKKYQKISEAQKLERGDVIRLLKWSRKPKVHWNGNDWVPNTPTEMELWIDSIERINNVWGDEEE